MTGGLRNWRFGVDADDWMRFMEKRLMHEERRPQPPAGSTFVDGLAQYAHQTYDWNEDRCVANGYFYSLANLVQNSPDNTKGWMGVTEGAGDGHGIQTVWSATTTGPTANPTVSYSRQYWTTTGSTVFGAWQQIAGGGGGGSGNLTGPRVRMYKNVGQNIGDGNTVQVGYQVVEYEDPATFGDLANNRLVIPEDGIYTITANAIFEAAAGGTRSIGIYRNGTQIRYSRAAPAQSDQSLGGYQIATTTRWFLAGDFITVMVYQNELASMSLGIGIEGTSLEAAKIGGPKGDTGPQGPPGSMVGGAGITQTGNVFDVVAANGSIVVGADNIQVGFAGTGSAVTAARSDHTHAFDTTSGDARYTRKFAVDVGGATSQVITHNLNTRDVVVNLFRNSTPWDTVDCEVERTSTTTCTLRFATAPAAAAYRVVVIGG